MARLSGDVEHELAPLALARALEMGERALERLENEGALLLSSGLRLRRLKQVGQAGAEGEIDIAAEPVLALDTPQRLEILAEQPFVQLELPPVPFQRGARDEKLDPPARDFFPDELADRLFERQVFPRNPGLEVEIAVVEAPHLHLDLDRPPLRRRFAVSRHALHFCPRTARLSFSSGTATGPTSAPTSAPARFASTAASS